MNSTEKAKAEAADKTAASGVDEKIKAIGTVSYTDACKAKIDAARKAYDALTTDQKKLVTNYSTLTDAEKKYADLKAEADKKPSGNSGTGNTSAGSTTGETATTQTTAPTTPTTTTAPKTATEQPTSQEKITILKAPAGVKAKAKKNKVQVSWKKIRKNKAGKKLLAQIRYIEVQAATDPAFKNIVATRNVGKKKVKATLKLQRKTTYYVRVRYVGADGVSKWSKVKKIKTK